NVIKLASSLGYADRLHMLSLGQGQGPKAEALIDRARDNGDWVMLQNCHLAASWMTSLERIQAELNPARISKSYRLWLTSMPSKAFPVPVLQAGIKITNEPPKGLRANLTRSFLAISEELFEGNSKPRAFKKLLFALAFFHAVILERRKFGPIGWNIPYEWMDSDFQVSTEQLDMYLNDQPGVPLRTLSYLVAEVNYGGRVTDDKDVRLITAILASFFRNETVEESNYRFSAADMYYAPDATGLSDVRELYLCVTSG
ncbi:dynein heavy chain, putative, partial [Perkinsus marinus ATCC 50983]